MGQRLMIALLGACFLLAGGPAQARKDGAGATANVGGKSPQHMSEKGQANTNSPILGQDKGALRADERKSDSGLMHDQAGGKDTKAKKGKKDTKGKSKGHDK